MLHTSNWHSGSVMRLIGMVSVIALVTAMLSFSVSSKRPYLVRDGVDCPCSSGSKELVITGNEYLRIKEGDPKLTAQDPHLVEFIRRRILAPSRYKVKPYATKSTDHSQVGQSPLVDKLLGHKTEGFHLEVGAANGETLSNSLFFELERNWTGLLIEANPIFYESMLRRNRHAHSINACLSPNNRTQALNFNPAGLIGGLFESMDDPHKKVVKKRVGTLDDQILIQCYPLTSILHALCFPEIDYFSLDVEGPEIDILRTIPWGKVKINVFTVEFRCWDGDRVDEVRSKKKLDKIRRMFQKTGLYDEVTLLPPYDDPAKEAKALDVVFKRKDLKTS